MNISTENVLDGATGYINKLLLIIVGKIIKYKTLIFSTVLPHYNAPHLVLY